MGALYVSAYHTRAYAAADEARQQIGAGKLNHNLGSSHLLYEERSFMKISFLSISKRAIHHMHRTKSRGPKLEVSLAMNIDNNEIL